MKSFINRHRFLISFSCIGCIFGGLLMFTVHGNTSQQTSIEFDYSKAYAVYSQKCMGCHASVADPEKPGKTRDDWHLVVNVMHGYGLNLTADQSELIIDLLYDLRKGMEKEAG
jgi:hypothetical protein